MAIYIDPPLWPAHGTLWSHLVSDTSYAELHQFAAQLGFPRRTFDLDHYDIPESQYARTIKHGAHAVTSRDVVHTLRDSGLRIKHAQRESIRPFMREAYLHDEWRQLLSLIEIDQRPSTFDAWQRLGAQLIARWNEPHRSYHDARHLEDVLLALNHLTTRGEVIKPETLLAAWFHDAVYTGQGKSDEVDSAALAIVSLNEIGLSPAQSQQVGEFIVATTPGTIQQDVPGPLAHLLDADLAIFASPSQRYADYSTSVRAEYAHVSDQNFRKGRANILRTYLNRSTIFNTLPAQELWEYRARSNLAREIQTLEEPMH